MKVKNLLVASLAIAASIGISSQSYAIPMDWKGYVAHYKNSGSVIPGNGIIKLRNVFARMIVLSPDLEFRTKSRLISGRSSFSKRDSNYAMALLTKSKPVDIQPTLESRSNDYDFGNDALTEEHTIDSSGTFKEETTKFPAVFTDFSDELLNSDEMILEKKLDIHAASEYEISVSDFKTKDDPTNLVEKPIPASVPEPGTVLLLGLGLLGVFYAGKRKNNNLCNAALNS